VPEALDKAFTLNSQAAEVVWKLLAATEQLKHAVLLYPPLTVE
jgi:hypothetical protein